MINWKYIIIGAALVVILGIIFIIVEYGTFIGYSTWFIPGIIVGYLVNNGYKDGAKNGFIAGIIGGFILGILQITFDRFLSPLVLNHGLFFILFFVLTAAVFFAICSAVGGIIGALIRDKI